MNKLHEAIYELANFDKKSQSLFGIVDKVNGNTCDVIPLDPKRAPMQEVLLNASTKQDGWNLIPKEGSLVVVSKIDDNEAYVAMFSEIEKAEICASDSIVFNKGEYGGLVKIKELEDNLKALKDYVEAMNQALPTAFNAVLASTSANGALGAQSYSGSMSGKSINLKNMENEKIKH